MFLLRSFVLLCALSIAPSYASAATISSDITGQAGVLSQTLPPAGASDFPDSVTVFAGTVAEGTLSAPNGLFNLGASLSTSLDSDPLEISFLQDVYGVQFNLGITDEFGGFLTGTVALAIGAEVFNFALDASGYEALAVTSNVGFQNATLSILNFDTNASAIAFSDSNAVLAATMAPIPLPAGGLLLLSGLMVLMGRFRSRA